MEENFQKTANRVSLVSIIVNLLLSVFKLMAGIIAKSGAMVSDAVHSASDVFSTIVVLIGIRVSSKDADEEHPYGHERMECVAAILLATILLLTGLSIGYSALRTILSGNYAELEIPGILALIAAIVSIVVKEAMFWYTKIAATRIDSAALMADAWHHRSDALSSVGALIGIGGAKLGYPVLEPIASFVICLFVLKATYDIFKDAIDKMVDKSCDEQFQNEIKELVKSQEGVCDVDLLQTRLFGNKIYVDIEISADGNMTLTKAHDIAENIHTLLETTYPKIKHIMVHVNPV